MYIIPNINSQITITDTHTLKNMFHEDKKT